jgi:hypothetical protein
MAIGALNVVAVSGAITVMARDFAALVLVVEIGIVPGVVTGAILGAIAEVSATRAPVLRTLVLAAMAIAVVFGLGTMLCCQECIPLASIPTMISAVWLERRTRRTVLPPLPVATMQPYSSAMPPRI